MKKLLTILLIFILGMSLLAGCGRGGNSTSGNTPPSQTSTSDNTNSNSSSGSRSSSSTVTGKYNMVVDAALLGEEFDEETLEIMRSLGMDLSKLGEMVYIELLADGTFKMIMDMFGEEMNEEGVYKIDGKTITLTIDGEKQVGTIEGNRITIESDGQKMVFEKK